MSAPPYRDDGGLGFEGLRAGQEREIFTRHSIVELEFSLAREAAEVGRALARVGLSFDPLTFIAARILEVSAEERADPVDVLEWLVDDGSIDRSVELACETLDADEGATG